jgi:hypothetical protein
MRQAAAILLKFLFTAMLVNLVLPLVGRSTVPAATAVAMVITFVTFILGDMYLLPRHGTIVAAAGEVALDTIIIWGAPLVFSELAVPLIGALAVAIVLGFAEYLFHFFAKRTIYSIL